MENTQAQRLFAAAGYYKGEIDGDAIATHVAAMKLINKHKPRGYTRWAQARQIVGGVQIVLKAQGKSLAVDGYYGSVTAGTLSEWERLQLPPKARPAKWERPAGELIAAPPAKAVLQSAWPTQRGITEFFGKPGENQVRMTFPTPMKLAWDTDVIVRSTMCHKKAKTSFEAIWEEVHCHYGASGMGDLGLDLFGGCLNVRRMRGGRAWSMHSWGIAMDIDPARNRLKWNSSRAHLAKPEYNAFWKAVEDQGALSLGRARNFDWMHFQFARL